MSATVARADDRFGAVMDPVDSRAARFEAVVEIVYEPLQRYLGRRAASEDACEVLNDALLVVWRRLDDIPVDEIRPWAYGVANRCLANHRRAARRRLRLTGRVASHPPMFDEHEEPPGPGELRPALAQAVAALDESDRELVRLWAWERLEPREIAVVLDSTANAVSSRLTRVKKKLAASLVRQDSQPAGHEGLGHNEEIES